ncbi:MULTISPECIES: DUF6894 family protein [unclassified Bradyrhizobium]
MPRYYFDFHDAEGVTTDETGEELPGDNAARAMAMIALGEVARDVTMSGYEGLIAIEVRDEKKEPLLAASAVIQVISSKPASLLKS